MSASASAPLVGTSAVAAPRAGHRRMRLLRALLRNRVSMIGLAGVVLMLLLAVIGPLVAPYDPAGLSPARLRPPSLEHLMGTENFGRDVFSRFLNGSRVSMFVAVGAITFGLVIGTLLGMIAGLRGGSLWDTVIMRGMDVLLAFPLLVLVPVLAGILQTHVLQIGPLQLSNIAVVGLAIGVVYIPVFGRVARGSVLAEVREDYILAARAFGVRTRGLLFGNLLPNILSPLIVQAAFSLAQAIVIEAGVSFLGLGVQPPDASWGNMLADARKYVALGSWWLVLFPSLAIAIAVLSFNLLGDALRDALDPRSVSSASMFADVPEA